MSVRHFTRQAWRLAGSLTCLLVLAGCGNNQEKGATQVVAKVNSGEITVHQVNQILEQQGNIRPEQLESASRRVLERLIDQELAVQKATELKVDREPRVVAAIEAARRDIIARAYLDRLGGASQPPTREEVTAYFDDHPGLFSNRKLYKLQALTLDVPAAGQPEILTQLKSARTAADFMAWLEAHAVKFDSVQLSQPAENLPIDQVEALSRAGVGHVSVQQQPQNLKVTFLMAANPAPLTLEASRTAIEKFLVNDRKRQLVQEELKHLRASAKIEYTGAFASGALPQPEAAEASGPASGPAGLDETTLKKGLGLK